MGLLPCTRSGSKLRPVTALLFFFLAWIAALCPEVTGQAAQLPDLGVAELETGTYYRPGIRVRASRDGVSFTVPSQWFGTMPPGSQTLYLESADMPGLGLVAPLHHASIDDMEAHLNEPQVIDEGYVLHPVASAVRSDRRITATYHSGDRTGVAVALFGEHQSGILYLFTGPKDRLPAYRQVVEQLADTTRFFEPDETIKEEQRT